MGIELKLASIKLKRIAENISYLLNYHVNLQIKFCTCYDCQKNDIPCTHAFALILHLNYQYPFPLVFLPQFCSIQIKRDTYSTNFHPTVFGPDVLNPELHSSSEAEPPCNAPND